MSSRPSPEAVASLMPRLQEDLAQLVAIPSVSAPDYPPETRPALLEAHEVILDLLQDAGVEELDSHRLPKTAPFITGEIPAPPGAPTVLLYGHYDVVPAGDESKWESPAFDADRARRRDVRPRQRRLEVERDRARRRAARVGGAAAGRDQARDRGPGGGRQRPQHLSRRPTPSCSASDAMLIARHGQRPPGRADAHRSRSAARRCRHRRGARRSPARSTAGQYGGAAPGRAASSLLHALASLHDEHGDVAVDGPPARGVDRRVATARTSSASSRRSLPGLPLIGSGGLGSRVWSGPAITVTGHRRAVRRQRAQRGRRPARARASTSASIPSRTPAEAQAALVRHLESVRPFGIELDGARRRDSATASPPTRPGPGVRGRARGAGGGLGHGRRRSRRPAARSRSSTPCTRRCPRPRSCSSGRPTATPTSTPRTSASCSTSSRRRSLAEAEFFGRYAERLGTGRARAP